MPLSLFNLQLDRRHLNSSGYHRPGLMKGVGGQGLTRSLCLGLYTSLRCAMRAQEVKREESLTLVVNMRSVYLKIRDNYN